MSETDFCPSCGAENPAGQQRCASCGAGIAGEALVDDQEKQRTHFQQETFQWKWVLIGFLVIGGLHAAIVFGLFNLVFVDNMWVKLAICLVPYLAGGILIGALSPGKTFLEPFYASVLPALAFPFLVELQRVQALNPGDIGETMAAISWLAALAPILVYVMLSLFGAWIGEKIQGTV